MHTNQQMKHVVLEQKAGQHIWIATDILRVLGDRNASSRSRGYRQALGLLQRLEKEGYLHSRFFPEVGLTVFWRIP